MRDAEARERLDQLELTLERLPQLIADSVAALMAPALDKLTTLAEAFEQQRTSLLTSLSRVDGTHELLEVVEEELSTLQRELTVVRAQTSATSGQVAEIVNTFARVGRGA